MLRTVSRLVRHGACAAALAVVLTGGGTAAAAAPSGPGQGRATIAQTRPQAQSQSQGQGPVVATDAGAVRGLASAGVDEFLGVPYAAPPVGPLRWRPPQPASHWSGVREATAFAPHCAQPATPYGRGSTSEDCLYLNVFTPSRTASAGRRLPVMLWIHGGALVTGESDDYTPQRLVRDGAVVVSINYRLGALGFLAHPALAERSGGPSGDYGLMDQQAALRWVHRNIARFGGDASDVTVFGESAGGLSVLSQLASPGAHGLFQRAIVESGAYNLDQASLSSAEAAGESFAAQAGCADQSADCLRGLPVSTILADEDTSGYTPDVDGAVLPRTLRSAFGTGLFNHVPVLDGTNHDEYRLFVAAAELAGQKVTAANYQASIAGQLGVPAATAAVIAKEYPVGDYPSPPVALGAVGTDVVFACPALTVDRLLAPRVPTYAYEFNDENAPQALLPPVSFPYGAAHASELQYVFNTATAPTPGGLDAGQLRLAGAMQREWTGFAASGRPGWAPFAAGAGGTIASLVPPAPTRETASGFAADHHCAFWAALTGR